MLNIKAAPAAPLARRQRRALPWEARPAHAGPNRTGHADQSASLGEQAGAAQSAVFLAARLSSSRPQRLARSLRSRRMRSASPTLDPESAHQGLAPIEEEGSRAGSGLGSASYMLSWSWLSCSGGSTAACARLRGSEEPRPRQGSRCGQASFGMARPDPRCLRCRFYEPRVEPSTPPNAAYGRTGSTRDANAFSGWTSNMMLTTRIHTPSSGSTIDCRFSSLA